MNIKNFINRLKEHPKLLTKGFFKSNPSDPGFKKTSPWVGYSALFYLLPIFYIKDTNKWTTVYKILWAVQTFLVYMADYGLPRLQLQQYGKRKDSIIFGIDRLMATLMVLVMIAITYYYLEPIYLVGAVPPVYFVFQSKQASTNYNWSKMVVNQTLWHITGPIIASFVLYKIQLKYKLFSQI